MTCLRTKLNLGVFDVLPRPKETPQGLVLAAALLELQLARSVSLQRPPVG